MDLVGVIRRFGAREALLVSVCAVLAASFAAGWLLPRRTEAQLLSPGPLHRMHREVEGDANCGRCHASGRRVAANLCFDCHTQLGGRVAAGRGLHGTEYRGRDCGTCHVDHVGDAPLIRWPGGGRDSFDHRLTGYPLTGRHLGVGCDHCHDGRTSSGSRTYVGESTACRSCHEDEHEGRLGNDCSGCHTVEGWHAVDLDAFDHSRARFPLRGAHTRVTCAGCHGSPARYAPVAHDGCQSCHSDPHGGRFEQPCASCHNETSWDDVSGISRDDHPGLSLGGGHAEVRCERCHDRGTTATPSAGSACVSCHRRVHEADLGNNCGACHGGIRWLGLRRPVGLRAHESTPFPLHGRHVDVECDDCHDPSRSRDDRFRNLTFDRCTGCHADPHDGTLTELGADCAGCHDDGGFRPSHFGVAAHSHAGFVLDGRHEAVPCSGCHGSDRPRVRFAVARQACADCHENPHGTEFAAEMADGGCAHCHETAGWDRPRIDHSIFPLTGAHSTTACESCHSPSEEDRRTGSGASYRGLPHECGGCHEDEHAGQFRTSDPVRQCTECHDTASFTIASFDHAARTSFRLEGAHTSVECSSCHPTVGLRGGGEATRYRLGYRACADCHANPHASGGEP